VHREYFQSVSRILEVQMAVKCRVFCYDSETLTEGMRKNLKSSRNVIFVLTEGAVEKAAAEDYDGLRKTYAYVWHTNPHSLSLMSVNEYHVNYDIQYPEDMVSFKWLHRKKFDLKNTSAEDMAEELYGELRYNFPQREKRKLERLAEYGRGTYARIYEKARGGLLGALFCEIGVLAVFLILQFTELGRGDAALPLSLLAAVLGSVALGIISYLVMSCLYLRDRLMDVSVLFGDFRRRITQRLAVIFGIGLWVGMWALFLQLVNYADANKAPLVPVTIYIFASVIVLTAAQLVKVSLMLNTVYVSYHYVNFCERRPAVQRAFLIVYAVVAAAIAVGAFIVY